MALLRCVLLLGLLVVVGSCGSPDKPMAPLFTGANPLAGTDLSQAPNILLIVADDMGYTDVGAFGGEIPTPNIDALAAQGVSFTNFHVSTVCAPTRAMLLTGVDNHRSGMGTMGILLPEQRDQPGYSNRLNDQVVSIGRLLGDAGYHTYMAGKWHLGSNERQRPADRGFQRSFALLEATASHYASGPPYIGTYFLDHEEVELPDDFYSTDYYTDKLIEFIGEPTADEQPFFAYAAYTAPHAPLHASPEGIARHQPTYLQGWDILRRQRFDQLKARGLINKDLEYPPRAEGVPAWDSLPPAQQRTEARKMAVYAAMIDNMDVNIGRLLQHLRVTNRLDNTLVLFMSDNGPDASDIASSGAWWLPKALMSLADKSYQAMGTADSYVSYGLPWANMGSTHLAGHKGTGTEGGIRAPLIVSWPQRYAGARISHTLTTVVDIVPTLLNVAGVEHPGDRYRGRPIEVPDGGSLLPLLQGSGQEVARTAAAVGYELYGGRALFMGDWKLLAQRPRHGTGEWELYNLANDPSERDDLAAQMPKRLAAMENAFQDYVNRNGVIMLPRGEEAQRPSIWDIIKAMWAS